MKSEEDKIVIKGARTHNLKNINLEIPRGKMVVFTGLSGSGKSSLAFDTIFAEGQRRYVESLSSYARQFLKQMQKPDVDEIRGLSPAISIDQKSRSNNPRSTVATITEIYDYLRVLYARVGKPYCLTCARPIVKLSNAEIVGLVKEKLKVTEGSPRVPLRTTLGSNVDSLLITSPLIRGRKGEYYQLLYDLLDKGYGEVFIDGVRKKLRERIILDKNKKHEIEVIVDEIPLNAIDERLSEGVERALNESNGLVKIIIGEESNIFSAKFACPHDGFSYPEIEPRLFSFNSPYGACPTCHGLGTKHFFGTDACEVCQGNRLRPEALEVRLGNDTRGLASGNLRQDLDLNIVEVTALSIEKANDFFSKLKLTEKEHEIAKVILKEIESRLKFLLDVGLDYITLDRRAHTLSGGEAQRIRLASQLGSRLVGALYVLDEPTIGLHSRDNERLVKTLHNLRDIGNTIIVVEHDEDTIYASDYLVDIGPGAGVHGGKIVVADDTEKLLTAKKNNFNSLTVDYLRGDISIPIPDKRRTSEKGVIKIRG